MAIEFRCAQCGKLLRTGDDTAGKQAKCPECGNVMTIPLPTQAPSASNPEPSESLAASLSPAARTTPPATGGALLDLSEVYSRTWAIFKEQWSACLGAWLAVILLNLLIGYGLAFGGLFLGNALSGPRAGAAFSNVGSIVAQLVAVWINIGLALFFLKIARGQTVELSELFNGGPYFITILLATLLFLVIFYVGILLCIVPGVIFALMFSQFYYLILDRQTGVIDAFQQSRELTRGNKLTLFLIGLIALGIMVLAAIPCGLGLLVAGPYFCLMFPMIYLLITGQATAGRPTA